MRSYIAAFLLALVITVLATPLARWLAFRVGAVAHPRVRDVHTTAIPRLGGVAIALGLSSPIAALLVIDSGVAETVQQEWRLAIGLLLGGLINATLGYVDDTRGVRALTKLLVQVAAASVAYAFGFVIGGVSLPIFGVLEMGVFAYPITILWIVGVTNAVNLIDGLDGLAGGVVFFAGVTNMVVAVMQGHVFVALVMACLLGAVLGFLFFNFNPARIFMGDSGSYFLGFVLAASSLAGAAQKASTTVALLVPVIALGVPIFDTLFAMLRRALERRPIFSPDRGHVHHRLLDMGLTHRRAVLALYGVSVALTAGAIAVSLGQNWQVGAALVAVTAVMLGLIRFVGYFEYLHLRRRQRARFHEHRTEVLRRTVPAALRELAAAATEREVLGVLDRFGQHAEMLEVSVWLDGEPVHRWGTADAVRDHDVSSARYPVGPDRSARAHLSFRWSGGEEVAPQVDILLQLIADALSLRLAAFESRLGPAPESAEVLELNTVLVGRLA